MSISHIFHLNRVKPQHQSEGGYRLQASKKEFPLLSGMAFYKLVLNPNAIREPHWHANADELGYCLKGKILVSLFASGNQKQSFIVTQGQAFFVPSGTLHGIENIGEDVCELIIQFSNENPEDFGISSMFGMFSDAVLGNTWAEKSDFFHSLKRSTDPVFIAMRQGPLTIPEEAYYPSNFRYDLEGALPLISAHGGTAKVARQNVWAALKRQAVYSLFLNGSGMREPHWHPETAELGYVHQGKGRMSILSPNGEIDTYEMNEGDIYFIPKAYPHHIENLTANPLHLLIFFDQAMPGDIGLTASVKSYSDEVLTSVFNSPKDFFSKLPTYYQNLFIVNKTNPID